MANQNAELLEKVREKTATVEDRKRLKELNRELAVLAGRKTASRSAIREELAKRTKELAFTRNRKGEIAEVLRDLVRSEKVDLLFVVDCTHSMTPHIKAVKDRIVSVVHGVMARSSALQMRVGFLGYRDLDNEGYRFEQFDFSEEHAAFQHFVGKVEAKGGAPDYPEDIAGALDLANKVGWVNPTRVLVHIADYPCHGRKYHSFKDKFAAGDPSGLKPEQSLQELRALGVDYYFGRLTEHTDQMIRIFNDALGRSDGSEYISVFDATSSAAFSNKVSASVSKSIAGTFTVMTGRKSMEGAISVEGRSPGSTRTMRIRATVPEWSTLTPQPAKVFALPSFNKISDLKDGRVGMLPAKAATAKGDEVFVKLAPHAFAKGANRYAIWAQLGMGTRRTPTATIEWETKVAKQFKKVVGSHEDKSRYLAQMENSNVAAFLARQYNKSKDPGHKSIEFLRSYVVDVNGVLYGLEKQIPASGAFERFSSNSGFWDPEKYDPSLGAFTRWTLRVTDGYLMVSDLQGVKLADRFVLTDSAILCEDLSRFGGTNLGPDFMERVLKSLKAMESLGRSD